MSIDKKYHMLYVHAHTLSPHSLIDSGLHRLRYNTCLLTSSAVFILLLSEVILDLRSQSGVNPVRLEGITY